MISGRADFDDSISDLFRGLSRGLTDLRPLAHELGRVMIEGNRSNLGTDRDGNPLALLKPSTIKRRKGTGPPLAPHDQRSRIVSNAILGVSGAGGTLALEIRWSGCPWLGFHETGTKWMPARDIFGIRPNTMDAITGIVTNYFGDLLNIRQNV